MKNCIRKAVRFDRVSSEEQREGFSLKAQKEMGNRYASEHGLTIVKTWSVDESAYKEKDRKNFFEMIDYIKENNIKDVIFDRIDRAVRGTRSQFMIEELVESEGVRFHFARDHLIVDRSSAPQEKLRFALGGVLGKYYGDNLSTEIHKGIDERWESGHWLSKAPFGYINQNKRVVVHPEYGSVAVEVFNRYATGNYTLNMLVDYIKSKVTDRTVTKRLVETMLSNPFYYGYMKGSRGKRSRELKKGAHEPIISKTLWDQCQRIRGIRATNQQSERAGSPPKPFMVFMKCGVCNRAVTGKVTRKASGKVYVHYYCASNDCPEHKKNVNQNNLFKQLDAAFEPFARFTPKATQALIETLQERLEDLDEYTNQATNRLMLKRKEIKASVERLEVLAANGELSEDELQTLKKVKEEALVQVTAEISIYTEADRKTFEKGASIIELLINVRNFMQKPGNELAKVRLAKMLLSNPTLKNRTLEYSYEKPFDVLIDLTSNKNWWRRILRSRTRVCASQSRCLKN